MFQLCHKFAALSSRFDASLVRFSIRHMRTWLDVYFFVQFGTKKYHHIIDKHLRCMLGKSAHAKV